MAELESQKDHAHPTVGQYVEIGAILAVLTVIEVALYVAEQKGLVLGVVVPGLLVLTAMKFLLVVLWFMHLRFDHKLFRRLFFTGVVGATAVFAVVVAIQYFGNRGNQ